MFAVLRALGIIVVNLFKSRRRLEAENPTVTFDRLFAFLDIGHGRRQLLWLEVTRHPTAEWLARQITEAFPGYQHRLTWCATMTGLTGCFHCPRQSDGYP
jgi:hypothetical protein